MTNDVYIPRSSERIITEAFSTFKAVLITGARQTGKSTLVRHLYPNLKGITFDDPFLEDQAKNEPETFLELNAPPVFLDEVQYVPQLFRYLKMVCDGANSSGMFLLTGSQPLKLMDLVSDSLAGRVAIFELNGLSMREILHSNFSHPFVPTMEYVHQREASVEKPGNLWELIHRGSFPRMQQRDVKWETFYSSYVKTYLERDVREITAVQDLTAFRNFMVACAARTGNMLNYASIAKEVGKDVSTVKNWVSVLEASGVVFLLEPFSNNLLKRVVKTPKLYFKDAGLAAYLTRWLTPETLAAGAMSGQIFETFVVSEAAKSFANAGLDFRHHLSYYRGRDMHVSSEDVEKRSVEAEIDLIIEVDGFLHPVEIKKTSKVTASMTNAFQVLDKVADKNRGCGAVLCNAPSVGKVGSDLILPVWWV